MRLAPATTDCWAAGAADLAGLPLAAALGDHGAADRSGRLNCRRRGHESSTTACRPGRRGSRAAQTLPIPLTTNTTPATASMVSKIRRR
jgi:hypothetical protein